MRLPKRHRIADILEGAAARIESRDSRACCAPIEFSVGGLSRERREAEQIFDSLYHYDSPIYHVFPYFWWPRRDRESRIIALLLAAEVLRTNCQP